MRNWTEQSSGVAVLVLDAALVVELVRVEVARVVEGTAGVVVA
jgi:hypothetical protein